MAVAAVDGDVAVAIAESRMVRQREDGAILDSFTLENGSVKIAVEFFQMLKAEPEDLPGRDGCVGREITCGGAR